MAKLTTAVRKKIPATKFALPKERRYPIHDKAHAQNAKARATQQLKAGNIRKSTFDIINSAANKVLKAKGAKTLTTPSGKTVKIKGKK